MLLLQPSRICVTCVDGRSIEVAGSADLNIDWGQCQPCTPVVAADVGHGGILVMDALCQWGPRWMLPGTKCCLNSPKRGQRRYHLGLGGGQEPGQEFTNQS